MACVPGRTRNTRPADRLHLHRRPGSSLPHMHRDSPRRYHVCTATGLTPAHIRIWGSRTRGRPIASGHRNQPTCARLERGSARPACNDDERAGAPALIAVRLRSDRKLGPALQQVVEARVARRRRSGRVGTRRAHCSQRQAKAPTGTGPSRQRADAPTDRPRKQKRKALRLARSCGAGG